MGDREELPFIKKKKKFSYSCRMMNLSDLPLELLGLIFQCLMETGENLPGLLHLRLVCKAFDWSLPSSINLVSNLILPGAYILSKDYFMLSLKPMIGFGASEEYSVEQHDVHFQFVDLINYESNGLAFWITQGRVKNIILQGGFYFSEQDEEKKTAFLLDTLFRFLYYEAKIKSFSKLIVKARLRANHLGSNLVAQIIKKSSMGFSATISFVASKSSPEYGSGGIILGSKINKIVFYLRNRGRLPSSFIRLRHQETRIATLKLVGGKINVYKIYKTVSMFNPQFLKLLVLDSVVLIYGDDEKNGNQALAPSWLPELELKSTVIKYCSSNVDEEDDEEEHCEDTDMALSCVTQKIKISTGCTYDKKFSRLTKQHTALANNSTYLRHVKFSNIRDLTVIHMLHDSVMPIRHLLLPTLDHLSLHFSHEQALQVLNTAEFQSSHIQYLHLNKSRPTLYIPQFIIESIMKARYLKTIDFCFEYNGNRVEEFKALEQKFRSSTNGDRVSSYLITATGSVLLNLL